MMKTVYLMRLWTDGSISVVFSGSYERTQRYIMHPDWLAGLGFSIYAGRHWIAADPVVRPRPTS